MGLVRVEDVVLWIGHIRDDDGLKRRLLDLPPDATVSLAVAGRTGIWQKMKSASVTGKPTGGLKPQGDIKAFWVDLYNRYKPNGGILVAIEDDEVSPGELRRAVAGQVVESRVPIEYPDPTVRASAVERIRAIRKEGWASNGSAYGNREQWYAEDGV